MKTVVNPEHRFLDRELSQIEFNRRVLHLAEDPSIPLLERLRYICIVSSNLDEFFEVRIASHIAKRKLAENANVLLTQDPSLMQAIRECHVLADRQYAILNDDILPSLSNVGIKLLRSSERTPEQQAWVAEYFRKQVRPLLTPIVLDPSHPFPQVINKSLNFIVELADEEKRPSENAIAIIKAPRVVPRVIKLPEELSDGQQVFCLLSSVIHTHVKEIFHDREVVGFSQFRVTRDSDLWVDEDDVKNLRLALRDELLTRHYGFAVRVEVAANCPAHLSDYLVSQFGIYRDSLFAVHGPVNLVRLLEIVNSVAYPTLRFPVFTPGVIETPGSASIFSVLRKRDILLHHPFQSFQTVLDFIRCAALDPEVIAIKQTIYRTGMNSDLMESLIIAAQRGKEVTVVVELMARFDEEANINWAERLERAGAQVVYGVVGLKTHAKMAMVIRREHGELKFYAHLGTGNYHPTTTKFYTDFGLLTGRTELGQDVNEVFQYLTSMTIPKGLSFLWVAPFSLRERIISAIGNERGIAEAGRPARIIAKMNALVDEEVIEALYAASQAGVKIDLIVRGACTLRPGVRGLSANIRVRSIVGRFLEHTRVFYFRNDRRHDLYLSSADWMSRNLTRRVEIAFSIIDSRLKKQVLTDGLTSYLKDNVNSWQLDPDGRYRRRKSRKSSSKSFSAQQSLAVKLGTLNG